MAVGTYSRPSLIESNIHEDGTSTTATTTQTTTTTSVACANKYSILTELPLNSIQNNNTSRALIDSDHFEDFPLQHLVKENCSDNHRNRRRRGGRPSLDLHTFLKPSTTTINEEDDGCEEPPSSIVAHAGSYSSEQPSKESLQHNPLAIESRRLPGNPEQVFKHQAGQYEWILSIPAGGNSHQGCGSPHCSHTDLDSCHRETKKQTLFFGCNLLNCRSQFPSKGSDKENTADSYTLLATRILGDEEHCSMIAEEAQVSHAEDTGSMVGNQSTGDVEDTIIISMDEPQVAEDTGPVHQTPTIALSPAMSAAKNDDMAEQAIPLSPSTPGSASRIEDSVEALDKLEEELEALSEVASLDRVMSPEETKPVPQHSISAMETPNNTPHVRTGSMASRSASRQMTFNTVQASTIDRRSSVRKSSSMASTRHEEQPATTTKPTTARKSLIITRPASLLPPKAPPRFSKPPTVPDFELPGEAVARRLKEKREARLSQMSEAGSSSLSPSKQLTPHVKSTKPLTRPTFELPGDAISRRKREEREARLKAQEEEERKRREFKARPIRTSLATGAYPRETLASRARMSKLQQQSEAGSESAASTPVAKKRHSIAVTTSQTVRATHSPAMVSSAGSAGKAGLLSATLPSRGRRTTVMDSQQAGASRATSTSTSSIHGGGSTAKGSRISASLSAEEAHLQRQRGKEILARDNRYAADRDRERREREEATKRARQEAAEKSRRLARENAERKKLAAGNSVKRRSVMGGVPGSPVQMNGSSNGFLQQEESQMQVRTMRQHEAQMV